MVNVEMKQDQPVRVSDIRGWEQWTFEVSADGLGVSVRAPEGDVLSGDTLRRVPWGTVLRLARAEGRDLIARAIGAQFVQSRRPYGGSAEHDAAVVALYRLALNQDAKPSQTIGEAFGVGPKTVSRWLTDLRRRDLLKSYAEEREAARHASALDGFPDDLDIEGSTTNGEPDTLRITAQKDDGSGER